MKALSKRFFIVPGLASIFLILFSSCTKSGGKPGGGIDNGNGSIIGTKGNAEAYSGHRPLIGTYFLADSRVKPDGVRGKITISENTATYQESGSSSASEISLSEIGVTGLGIVSGATAFPPVITYLRQVYGASGAPPSASSADYFPRAFAHTLSGETTYEFVVMAQGPADPLLNSKVLILSRTGKNQGELIADLPVFSSTVSEKVRIYSGSNFMLRIENTGSMIVATSGGTVGGVSFNFSGMKASDTFLSPPPAAISFDADKLAAGDGFSCGIHNGGAYCWGNNDHGQLGDGTNEIRRLPNAVKTLGSGVSKIVVGASHACAIQRGKLYCWGSNNAGELGRVGVEAEPGETAVGGEVTDVAAGNNFTCAIAGGNPSCWGTNGTGNLGLGHEEPRSAPSLVVGYGSSAVSVVAGLDHACAIDVIGNASCWGNNEDGQVGIGSTIQKFSSPQPILSKKFISLSAGGKNTCGIAPDGGASCWGSASYTIPSGDAIQTPALAPNSIAALNISGSLVTSISVGGTHACAISGSALLCWGTNTWGEMASGSPGTNLRGITQAMAIVRPQQVSCGSKHTLVVTGEGLRSFGYGWFGQLGVDGSDNSNMPLPFSFF